MTDIAAALRSARDALMRTFEDQQATEAYYLVKDAIPAAEAVPALVDALRRFAALVPSSLYAEDGSDKEGYEVILARLPAQADFDGNDLARVRAALAAYDKVNK